MIVGGVDIAKINDWFFNTSYVMNQSMEISNGSGSQARDIVQTDIIDLEDSATSWIFSGLLNPPLLNSLIQKPNLPSKPAIFNPYKPPRVLGTKNPTLIGVTNPMFFFGTSIFSIGFGISLIPSFNMALMELGLIDDPDSLEYQIENTF